MTDIALALTQDGVDLALKAGVIVTSDGLSNAAMLSLFGGNEEDDGREDDDPGQWWGNLHEPLEARQMRSETGRLLRSLPLTTGNIQRIREAAVRDLAWMTDGIVDSLSVTVSVPAVNRVKIDVAAVIGPSEYRFDFLEHWSS